MLTIWVRTLLVVAACGLLPDAALAASDGSDDRWRVTFPEVILTGVPFQLTIEDLTGAEDMLVIATPAATNTGQVGWRFRPAGRTAPEARAGIAMNGGSGVLEGVVCLHGDAALVLSQGGTSQTVTAPRVLPGWLSVLPPLLAIGLALLTRQVHLALLLGVWFGVWVLESYNPIVSFQRLGDRFLVDALADRDHASILIFSTLLGGMVGILSQAGATEGVVSSLARRVRRRRQGQLATAMMGTVIFFDDYANTLLVGNSMRPLTDRLRISREKLAYLVDSTAAPVATIAVISTWVGFEVGLIQDAMARQGGGSAYSFFLRSIPYGFYPILTLWFVYLIAGFGRDFGAMRAAEKRAYATGEVLRPGAQPASDTELFEPRDKERRPAHPLLAIVPIGLVIFGTGLGLWWDGAQKLAAAGETDVSLRQIINSADSFAVLMWAALAGALCALALTCLAGRLSLRQAVDGWLAGAKAMLIAMVILILAWALSGVCASLQTAPFLVELCQGALSARWLPCVTFLLSATIGFATGTSWGTMAILMPLIYPLGAVLPASEGLAEGTATGIHLAAVSAVLSGAVFGDHCSPISDTTIMSSLASGSDHIDHVRTQLPYAGVVAAVAVVSGYVPTGFGLQPLFSLLIGAALLLLLLMWRGRRADE